MNGEQFAEIVELQLNICKDVLVDKAREYAPDEDRLHNFRVAAELQGIDMLEALAGMMCKHTVSIYDMCGSEEVFSTSHWSEKITDHINYLILLRAIVQEIHEESLAEPTGPFIVLDDMAQDAPMEELKKSIHNYFNTLYVKKGDTSNA